jgi:acetylornithine/N-succinyldiaminopimelate aminotransferase
MEDLLQKYTDLDKQDFFHTYNRLPIVIERGEGCYLYTDKGEKILDMFGGLAVNVLGYNHPRLIAAIEEQIKKYIHISNYFYQEKQIALADKILQLSGFKKVFFSNSGTEAIEAAIKLVRKYFLGSPKKTLISFSGSFHGRTMGALSLTARKKYRDQFAPLLPDVKHLEFNSIKDLNENINETTAAVFIECIQGEGGINMASVEFIDVINVLKQKYGFIVVADEIQSGVGRTGRLHGYEHFSLDADVVVLAKGIGGGLPLGAILGSSRVENVFDYGEHGSTFGGNPVAAACGHAIFEEFEAGLIFNVIKMGDLLMERLTSLKDKHPGIIKEVRGKGLMIGIELHFEGEPLVKKLIEDGVLVNSTNGNVIRLLPPFIITEDDINFFIEKFDKALS